MKFKQEDNIIYIILDKGEEVMKELHKFLLSNNIDNGFFNGIGSVIWSELGFFNSKEKKYHFKKFSEEMEVLNLNGNITRLDNKPLVHAHITLSDSNFNAIGGHLKEAIVGVTFEIILIKNKLKINRRLDDDTGLNLWSI